MSKVNMATLKDRIRESRLLNRVINGDSVAIRTLVEDHSDQAYSVAFRVLGNREDAEEVVHDSFLKAFAALHRFNRFSRFSTWLYRIVYHTAINQLKSRKEMVDFPLADQSFVSLPADQWDELQEADRKKYMEIALFTLDVTDRLVITMHYFDQLSIGEISSVLSLGKSAIKMRLMRSRKILKKELERLLNNEANDLY